MKGLAFTIPDPITTTTTTTTTNTAITTTTTDSIVVSISLPPTSPVSVPPHASSVVTPPGPEDGQGSGGADTSRPSYGNATLPGTETSGSTILEGVTITSTADLCKNMFVD